jgi:hypothetical protein
MGSALLLPALPFECDVSGCSTDHFLGRALQSLGFIPDLLGATHGQPSSVVISMVTTPYQAPTTLGFACNGDPPAE